MPKLSSTELLQLFFREVESYIPEIRQGLDVLSSDRTALTAIQDLHRLFHNIKGASSQVQLSDLSNGVKVVESALDSLLEEGQSVSDDFLTALNRSADLLIKYCNNKTYHPDEGQNFHHQIVSFFTKYNEEKEAGSKQTGRGEDELQEYLVDIRSIFPLLQELAGCLMVDSSDEDHDTMIYGKLSRAVSILSATVLSAGMKQQSRLMQEFQLLLEKLHSAAIFHQPEISGLLQDFLQFLEVTFANENPEDSTTINRVEEKLQRFKTVLEALGQKEEGLAPVDRTIDLDALELLDDSGTEDESTDLLEESSGSDFFWAERTEEPEGGEDPGGVEKFDPILETSELEYESVDEDQLILMEIFREECDEHLIVIHQSLNILENQVKEQSVLTPVLKESVADMRRAVHTLKGAASMTGVELLARGAHSLEEMLDLLLDESGEINSQEVQIIASGVDVLKVLSQSSKATESKSLDKLVGTIDEYLASRSELESPEDESSEELMRETVEEITDTESGSGGLDALPEPEAVEEFATILEKPILEYETVDEDQLLLMEIFREECDEHLIVINQSLNILENQVKEQRVLTPALKASVSDMRRAVHTLKGAASMTGVELLAKGAHALEDMLDWLHDESGEINPQEVQVIATGIDLIELLSQSPEAKESTGLDTLVNTIDEYLNSRSVPESNEDESFRELVQELLEEMPSPDPGPVGMANPPKFEVEEKTPVALSSDSGTLRVKLEDLDELESIEGELVVARGAMAKMVDAFSQTLVEFENVKENLRRKSQELESGFEVQSLYGFNPATAKGGAYEPMDGEMSDFDPIELDRYSQLNLIIRSLNEITVDVNSIHATLHSLAGDIRGQIGKQQLTMRLMQDKLMRIRMTPLSSISRVLFRTVRDTATKIGKNVALTITGEDVYMDRFVWAKITDPLMHILRNGVDHGVESAEVRAAAGKAETATINLQAEQRSRYVVLRISDDGGGINFSLIKDKIIREGLAERPEALGEKELLEYLFHPSFTTRQEITTISGRGVGLDVVRKNVEGLRGSVQIYNNPGHGVVFEIQIPFSLSVNRAALVSVAGREFAVPLQDILEVKHFSTQEIEDTEGLSLKFRDGLVPVTNLGFHLRLEKKVETFATGSKGILAILFKKGDEQYAVAIDSVTEQREIVVKNIGSHLTHVRGISGVTLTGSGDLIPILNLTELVDNQVVDEVLDSEPLVQMEMSEPLKVLIVDDSISIRHSVARLVENQSWKQQQAVDGLDALAKLESFFPDVIILDIEMPRMNGYEFKSSINNQQMYKDIPVVMLTSRVSEKHQQKARDLGIDHYLTKPYQDDTFVRLLESIRSGN